MKGPHVLAMVPMDEVKAARFNPKRHDLPGIKRSLVEFGFVEPLEENEKTGRIVAGHGRLAAARELHAENPAAPPRYVEVDAKGRWLLPVVRGVGFKNEEEAEGYLYAANRQVELGGWDREALVPMLRDVQAAGLHVAAGFPDEEIARLAGEAGASVRGAKADGASGGVIRQIMLWFPSKEFEAVVKRLERIQKREGLESNTEVFLKVLGHYEAATRR